MRQYRIVSRAGQWQLLIEGQDCGLLQGDDRAFLVEIACRVAAERRTAVHVYDDHDELEARLSFQNGSPAVHGAYRGELGAPATLADAGAAARAKRRPL